MTITINRILPVNPEEFADDKPPVIYTRICLEIPTKFHHGLPSGILLFRYFSCYIFKKSLQSSSRKKNLEILSGDFFPIFPEKCLPEFLSRLRQITFKDSYSYFFWYFFKNSIRDSSRDSFTFFQRFFQTFLSRIIPSRILPAICHKIPSGIPLRTFTIPLGTRKAVPPGEY